MKRLTTYLGLALVALAATGCSSQLAAPRSQQHASPVATKQTSGTPTPDGVAFWDAKHGLLIVDLTTPACAASGCTRSDSVIERTEDGGKHWKVVDRLARALQAVAVAGTEVAWVTMRSPYCSLECDSNSLLLTRDGGASWRKATSNKPVGSVSPVSASTAWAISNVSATSADPTGTSLVQSTDGGRTWHVQPYPCNSFAGLGIAISTVNFSGLSRGSAVCAGVPATDMQAKAMYATTDRGASWTLQSECPNVTSVGQQPGAIGILDCVGVDPTLQLLAGGHGWMWSSRLGLESTSDGGRIWNLIARKVVFDDTSEVVTASLVSDLVGFVLIGPRPESPAGCPPRGCGPRLLSTKDGGESWAILTTWPAP